MAAEREPWCEARELLVPDEHGTVSFTDLAVWMHRHGAALLDVAEAAHALVKAENADSEALRRLETDVEYSLASERQRTARRVADLCFANLEAALSAAEDSQESPS